MTPAQRGTVLTWAVVILSIMSISASLLDIDHRSSIKYRLWWYCSGVLNYFGDYSSPSCPFLRGTRDSFSWGFPARDDPGIPGVTYQMGKD